MSENPSVWSMDVAKAAIAVGDFDGLDAWLQNVQPSSDILDELLMKTISDQQDPLFSLLLEAGASPSNLLDTGPNSPIFNILKKERGDVNILKLILENVKQSKVKKYVNTKDSRSFTALYVASKNGHLDCVKLLLNKGAKVNSPSGYDGFMPLMAAAEKGQLEILQILLEWGAYVNKGSMLGDNALCFAAKAGHIECIRELIKAGADVNSATKCGETPLMCASKTKGKDTLEAVKLLLKSGADVTTKDWRLQTTLWYASNFSNEEVALHLARCLNQVAVIDADLSLLVAVERDHSNLTQFLLEQGWNIDVRDKYGRSLLHIAAERGVTKCLMYILKSPFIKELDINEPAGRLLELTPLHLAIRWCHPEAVGLLLGAGADPDLCDTHNASPLISCMSTSELRSRATLAKLLLRHGCHVDTPVNPKVVQPWGHEQLEGTEGLHPSLEWALSLRELWIARMIWIAGADACRTVTWTAATIPWNDKHIYPEDEYSTTATKEDVLDFIETQISQPRLLADVCRICIRKAVPRPITSSLHTLPLPVNIIEFLDLYELDEIEQENLKADERIRENLSVESDDDYDAGSTSSEEDSAFEMD